MSYTPTTWATGDTITAEKLNKIEQGVSNAGGFDYDLIIETVSTSAGFVPSNLAVTKGNILDCEEIVANGGVVNGLLIIKEQASWTSGNTNRSIKLYPLNYWFGPYCYIKFGRLSLESPVNSGDVSLDMVCIGYDKNTGQITYCAKRTWYPDI